MPITKSAKKAIRQSSRKRLENLKRDKVLKALVKKEKFLISQKKKEEAKKLLPDVYKAIDKAAKTNVIKKEAADRKKSRIIKSLNKLD